MGASIAHLHSFDNPSFPPIGIELHHDFVTDQNLDAVYPHLACKVRNEYFTGLELDAKHRIG